MAVPYNHRAIEAKWRVNWEKNPVNRDDGKKEKYYCLDMFPCPSGSGLHVGHWRGYVISDVWSRYKLLQGYYLIHPMGWDAFGLSAQKDAIRKGLHPAASTAENITRMKKQLRDISALYDWDREVDTSAPEFYKWTQWIFVKVFQHGLVYEKESLVNWCPSCRAGLAREEAVNGVCGRCGGPVTKRSLRQWMLRTTAYADRLLDDLERLDWPEKVKKMQADWIGRSYGAEVCFPVEGREDVITVYTARPEILYGVTFLVLAPEHALAASLAAPEQREEVHQYIQEAFGKSGADRMQEKKMTGVFTGSYAVNPMSGEKIPIWLSEDFPADCGAQMCVPAHEERDFAFAKKFGLPIIQVIAKDGKETENMTGAFTEDAGTMIHSGEWNGMEPSLLRESAPDLIEKRGCGRKWVSYKLRDWAFSRQSGWGEPIPIVRCPSCGAVAVPEEELPLRLPGAATEEWVNTLCPKCGGPAKRETDRMPRWAGSSWYFLRCVDSKNFDALVSREKADQYLPADMYVCGVEHAVLPLLYARYCTKFLHDIGAVGFDEPFTRLFCQGMITGKNGTKMSESNGNAVRADDLVRDYGRDALRLYELFVGPPELDAEWDDWGIDGAARFLRRFWALAMNSIEARVPETKETVKIRCRMVSEITRRLESFSLNTAVSGFMEFTHKLAEEAKKSGGAVDLETISAATVLLSPFAPHIAEEIWEALGHDTTVFAAGWPDYDGEVLKEERVEIPVQVNQKTRAVISVPAEAPKEEVLAKAREALAGKISGSIVREIYVPKRIVNIVAK